MRCARCGTSLPDDTDFTLSLSSVSFRGTVCHASYRT